MEFVTPNTVKPFNAEKFFLSAGKRFKLTKEELSEIAPVQDKVKRYGQALESMRHAPADDPPRGLRKHADDLMASFWNNPTPEGVLQYALAELLLDERGGKILDRLARRTQLEILPPLTQVFESPALRFIDAAEAEFNTEVEKMRATARAHAETSGDDSVVASLELRIDATAKAFAEWRRRVTAESAGAYVLTLGGVIESD